jgi:hypothetical protein
MSTKAAILCEDHTEDRYILEPVIEAALKSIGIPRPRVMSITNPRMRGFSTLLKNLCDVVQRYHKTVSVLIIAFDLDGEDGEDGRPDKIARVRGKLEACDTEATNVVLLGCRMEAEVYAIWGSRSSVAGSWTDVTSERDPKELYFEPLLVKEDALTVDGGRTRLVRESLKAGWASLRGGCPELELLENDLRAALNIEI